MWVADDSINKVERTVGTVGMNYDDDPPTRTSILRLNGSTFSLVVKNVRKQ